MPLDGALDVEKDGDTSHLLQRVGGGEDSQPHPHVGGGDTSRVCLPSLNDPSARRALRTLASLAPLSVPFGLGAVLLLLGP